MTTTLRLLMTSITAVVLTAQNPLAMAADPFAGTFQNQQMKLDLSRTGQEYSGVILFGGQSLPVKAKAAAGKLDGTFRSQGQSYSFQATRAGTQLTLTTDGATHALDKVDAPVAMAATSPAVVGEWQGQTGTVRVNADGTAILGGKPHRWTLDGNIITFAGNGESVKVPFDMAGDTWTWKLPTGQLVLTRVTAATSAAGAGIAGSWQGPTGSVQINLDGTATVGGVAYRYTQAGNQLTLGGPDGTFVATVQRTGDSMTWLVNGKTLTFQRAATTWAVGGGSGTGGILPELVGKWCQMTNLNSGAVNYSRSACFTLLADGSFLYAKDFDADGQAAGGDNNDSGTWTATADNITSTSKKTGVRTLKLEKRNHPKTGNPMLVLDGAEFTTAYKKAPWR